MQVREKEKKKRIIMKQKIKLESWLGNYNRWDCDDDYFDYFVNN